jgi:hypothetical protein
MRLGFDPEFDGYQSYVAGVAVPQQKSSRVAMDELARDLSGSACWWSRSDRNVACLVDWCHRNGREDEVRSMIASPWSYTNWYCEMRRDEYEAECEEKHKKEIDALCKGLPENCRPGKAG